MHTEVNQVLNVVQEFSRFAHQYDKHNMIQAKVAKTLVEQLSLSSYRRVIDIGSGSGEVFKNFKKHNISVEKFVALDASQEMLSLHPSDANVLKICANFNEKYFFKQIPQSNVDLIISSSALQWSTDLDFTLAGLSKLSDAFHATVFTSGTFKTLHKVAGVNSPIYEIDVIQERIKKYYSSVSFTIHQYRLDFSSTREMFRYIKQSGVSSGERKLSYKQTKKLIQKYPLKYLEFEVLFVEAKHI